MLKSDGLIINIANILFIFALGYAMFLALFENENQTMGHLFYGVMFTKTAFRGSMY